MGLGARLVASAAGLALAATLSGCMVDGGPGSGAFQLPGSQPPPATWVLGSVTERPEGDALHVNGRRIALAPEMAVSDAFGSARRSDVRIGTVVFLATRDTGAGRIADALRIEHPLVGSVGSADTIDLEARRIEVLGIPVELPGTGRLAVQPGERVAVEGIWRGDGVVAARVVARPAERPAGGAELDLIAGTVTLGPDGGPMIGSSPLFLWEEAATPAPGTYLRAFGAATSDGFEVRRLERGRHAGRAPAGLSVEGYATAARARAATEPAPDTASREIDGLGMVVEARALPNARVLLEGPVVGGRFRPEHALPLPDRPGPRRILLGGDIPLARRLGAVIVKSEGPSG